MRAIILAAGSSTRLASVAKGKPKGLLPIGPKAILEHQIDRLQECGVTDLVVVVGNCADEVKACLGDRVTYILNPLYASTNNIYSLWCAREEVKGYEAICMHGDVLFHVETLAKLLARREDICLVVDRKPDEETMRIRIEGDHIVGVNKKIPYADASGTFIGVAKFTAPGGQRFIAELERLVEAGQTGRYFTDAIEATIDKGERVAFSPTDGLPWIDIDSPEDLQRAKEEVYPRMVQVKTVKGS